MGQPNPPGDIPLIEGLDPEWNDIVSALPEEQRSALGPKIKERLGRFEPLKQWEDFVKSGIDPAHAKTAIDVYSVIENNPKQVYDTLATHLGLTKQEVQQAAQVIEQETGTGSEVDPRIQTLEQQVQTLVQIALAQRNQSTQEQQVAEQEAALDKDITGLKKKYGEDSFDEREILMRMLQADMTAEQAYQDYTNMVSRIRTTRPAPMLMGSGGAVPSRAIDPTKLNSKDTRALVAQMMEHAQLESRKP